MDARLPRRYSDDRSRVPHGASATTGPAWSQFFCPGQEILIARSTEDMLEILREMPQSDARAIGERAGERVIGAHTAAHRAAELETLIEECRERVRKIAMFV